MRWSVRQRSRRRLALLIIVIPATFVFFAAFASAAFAGNFFATGHDQDFHCALGSSDECSYYKISTSFVRGTSGLPVLILDRDSTSSGGPSSSGDADAPYEAVSALNLAYSDGASSTPTSSSPPYVVEDPQGVQTTMINGTPPPGITTASKWGTTPLVDSSGNPLWSAVIVASDTNCGGCDLNNTDGTHLDSDAINARTSDIQSFFNAGGGLLYLAGATNAFDADGTTGKDVYYASVPVPVGGQPVSPPFTVTSDGAALGITDAMVNCCATHNSFSQPAAGSPIKVAETDSSDLAESLFLQGGSVCSGSFCSDQPITATGAPVSATEGQSFSGNVATFTDPDTSSTAGEYSATIDWGDGTTSTGTISGSGGNFTVGGTHTYAEEGSFTVKVTITDVDNTPNTATTSSTAAVADAALTATGTTISAVEGASKTQAVATFTDADPAGTVSDYTATINWGDGSTTTGTVAAGAPGFKASGTHTYAEEGTYTITVTIKDVGGATATAKSTAKVADAPLHAIGVSKITPRNFGGVIARFTDADPAGTVSDYTATIKWGDGRTSSGRISTGFKVTGTHRYAKAGVYHVTVTIKDKGGSTATARSKLTVAPPVAAGLHITHVSASPIKPGCETELRAGIAAAGRCAFGNMTIRGTIRKKARGKVHVTVFVPLLSGPVHGTARIVRGHWRLTLKVAGINKDNPEPIYRIAANFNGSPGVRRGHAQKRVRYESELHDLGPA